MKATVPAVLAVLLWLSSVPGECRERAVESGRQLYLDECARCHGVDRTGDGPDAPFFSPQPRDLTTGFVARYTTEELVARVRDGQPLSLSVDPEGRQARARSVEAILAHMQRLPAIDWKTMDAGGILYGERCEVCHGQFGKPWPAAELPEGVQAPPRDLRAPAWQKATSDAALTRSFAHGVGRMPAVAPELSPGQEKQLLAFVRLLSPGFERYSFYCAPCHGDDGRGRGGLPRAGEGPKVVFDREYLAGADPEVLRTKIWHMMDQGGGGMPHFKGAVDDQRLRAIVEYLRSTP